MFHHVEAAETLLINEPSTKFPERPIFPLTPKREKETLFVGRFHCPMCQPGILKHQQFIRNCMFEAFSPKDILIALKRKQAIPLDKNKDPILNPLDFEQVLGMHLLHCLGEDPQTYGKHWHRNLQNDQMADALKERMRQMGIEDQPTLTRAGQSGLTNPIYQAEPAKLPVGDLAGAEGLINSVSSMGVPDMLKELVQTELRTLVLQQRLYLAALERGDTSVKAPNPAHTSSVLQQLKTLIGGFNVSDMIAPDDMTGLQD